MVDLRRAVAGAVAMVLAASSAPAGAFMFVDPVNLIQNFISAYEAVQQVATSYEQLYNQYQQLRTMEAQLRGMDPSHVAGMLGDITGLQELKDIEQAMGANRDLMQSIARVRQSFDERLDTARLLRMSWREYVQWEKGRVQRKEESAVARVQAEAQAMRRIESDYDFARQQASRISGTAGTHEAMQLMNVQMNRVVQQNAELLRQMATAFGRSGAEKEMQEAEQKLQARLREDAYKAAREADLQADRAAVDAWKAHRR